MKKKIRYTDEPMRLRVIKDFLPPPDQLSVPPDTIKVTLNLKRSSVIFFKRQAALKHTKYQRMIRELVDRYVAHYKAQPTRSATS